MVEEFGEGAGRVCRGCGWLADCGMRGLTMFTTKVLVNLADKKYKSSKKKKD